MLKDLIENNTKEYYVIALKTPDKNSSQIKYLYHHPSTKYGGDYDAVSDVDLSGASKFHTQEAANQQLNIFLRSKKIYHRECFEILKVAFVQYVVEEILLSEDSERDYRIEYKDEYEEEDDNND